jgi:biopolymer transport protein ExbD
VLLIIFMILASLAIPPGFEREFNPCACAAPAKARLPQIEVAITESGTILVDGKRTNVTGLYGVLSRAHAAARKAKVALYADTHAPYGIVVRVLDAAKAAGIADVTFVQQ